MGYFEGFAVTFKKLFKGTPSGAMLTKDFPHEKREKPARFHGRHVLNRYEDGMEKCIGCELCAGVCPAKCIYVRGADNDPENPTSPGERFGFVYEINYLRCIHCDLCVEACPTQAITESKILEFSFTSRKPLRRARITVEDVEDQVGWYRCSIQIEPFIQFEGVSFTLSLVGKLDKQ